jgi:hypothetical protein
MVRMVSSHGGDTRPSTLWRIYVMATSVSPRNRPNPNKCGICYEVMCSTLKPVHITAIDMCAPSPTGGMHFDGQCPDTAGTGYATDREVASSNCQENKG